MAKSSSVYVCQNCGESFPKWQGQCGNCGEWNTLVETMAPEKSKSGVIRPGETRQKAINPENIQRFSQVNSSKRPKRRLSTMIGELDRVLGETLSGEEPGGGSPKAVAIAQRSMGMVPGAVMLIGGEPGIGKSTLLTQMVVRMLIATTQDAAETKSERQSGLSQQIMYVSGEESPSQISMRINRILNNEYKKTNNDSGESSGSRRSSTPSSPTAKLLDNLLFVTTTDVDEITSMIRQELPRLVIVDSIQTLQTEDLTGAEGSVGQLRESTQRITDVVKKLHIPTFLVGHVTKEGTIAGPKVLEHIVDTVLELSGERTDQLRVLRAMKNRFGATDEVGVFRVNEYGLEEVTNPSELFLEQGLGNVPGSATVAVMEGTRPLLVEVQALVVDSPLAMPRRVGRGVELSRIQVLSAVLQKHAYLPLSSSDIFVSIAGGFTVREPSVDLGLAMAVVSSLKNKPLPEKTVFIGEVGLLGEIRAVNYLERRIKEAKRLGYTTIISRQNYTRVSEVVKKMGLG